MIQKKSIKQLQKNDDFNANDNINENKFNDLQNMLDRVNLDEVSPKDALDILYAMKKTSKIMEVKQKIIDKEFQTLKKSFLAKREKIKIDFLKQNKAINCCKANSKLIDELIVEIYKSKTKHQIESNVIFCICAVGGYGRELLAPHSDLDLLFYFKKM